MFRKPLAASLLILTLLMQTTPVTPQAWVLASQGLQPVSLPTDAAQILSPVQNDLDGDSQPETLSLAGGRAAILSGEQTAWQSPAAWQVTQAALSDLNGDSAPEAVLLVWRPFQPWPVDRWLPHGGHISDFHNAEGRSCHIILIGWQYGRYKELWAGSALA